MSVEVILSTLEKLEKMHKSLLELSYKKTELIKMGNMDGLDQLLKDEQAHVAAISQLEQQRQNVVKEYLKTKGIVSSELLTVAQVIEVADTEREKQTLSDARKRLLLTIEDLKWQNDLNQKLTFQSLQFVNMTLDLLRPRPDQITYTKTEVNGNRKVEEKTYFDSQA